MRAAAVLVAAILLSGCATPALSPQTRIPLAADDPRPARWLAELVARADARRSLRGILRVSVDAEDLSYRATQRVAAERPARLRVEVMGLFGQVAAVLTTDGREYEFAEAGSGEIQRGPVTEDLLWQVARVDLQPGEAVGLLMGAPATDPALALRSAYRTSGDEIHLQLQDDRGREREHIAFDASGRLRGFDAWDDLGRPVYEARFDEYRDLAGEPFADLVEIRFPRTRAAATLRFRGVELNPDLVPALFTLEPASSAARGDGFEGGAAR